MESLRIQRGVKIEVNDNGDCIFLDAENTEFMQKFYGLVQFVTKMADEVKADAKGAMKNADDAEALDYVRGKMVDVIDKLDDLFGDGASAKIFGEDVIPSAFAVLDLFRQLTPIAERYANERNNKFNEVYNKSRKGGKNV